MFRRRTIISPRYVPPTVPLGQAAEARNLSWRYYLVVEEKRFWDRYLRTVIL